MKFLFPTTPAVVVMLASLCLVAAEGPIFINEIADKGTSNVCDTEDWVELYNNDTSIVDLSKGYILHDEKGVFSDDAFIFPTGMSIHPKAYLLLCLRQCLSLETTAVNRQSDEKLPDPWSPQFGIRGDDTVTLVRLREDGTFENISSVGPLPNSDNAFDVTYARHPGTTEEFAYTSTPTPGAPNTWTPVKSREELDREHKVRLAEQEREGRLFFNMDGRGLPVASSMDTVLQFHITMDEDDYRYTLENRTFEQYRPFQKAEIKNTKGEVLLTLDSPGRLRPKGQSSLTMPTCLNSINFPFQLDMDSTNASQSLYGVQRVILRHHLEDFSYIREWSYYRMLARFGLPHLRARKVLFSINNVLHGFYTLLEAPDQEYVFARSFPNYNPQSFALFKFKAVARDCGRFTQEEIARAEDRVYDKATPPYAFDRGEHLEKVEALGLLAHQQCLDRFEDHFLTTLKEDVIVAYLRYDKNCGEMMVKEHLMDRDLGKKDYDDRMKDFINEHLAGERCIEGCANSNLVSEVDTDNFLKTFAFYATTLNLDSVINWLNNFYLAQSTGDGWKLVAYDLNHAEDVMCHSLVCDERLVDWSIARPTCASLEDNPLVGPLLLDPQLHAKYLSYVQEFTETIYTNASLIAEMEDHLREIRDYVRADYWSFEGSLFDNELTPEAAPWNSGFTPPLLPFMKSRSESIQEQLKAVIEGSFPRGPHVGFLGDNEAWETCADWRLEQANRTVCTEECRYEGCHVPGWAIESWCDEGDGLCYHGDADDRCLGIPDGAKYDGMEDTEDGRETFCYFAKGLPVNTAVCPEPGVLLSNSTRTMESSTTKQSLLVGALGAILAIFLG